MDGGARWATVHGVTKSWTWLSDFTHSYNLLGFPQSSVGKESACNSGDPGLIPGLGKSAGEGIVDPLQYSGMENSMNCIVHGVAKSWTWLSDLHFHFHITFTLWIYGLYLYNFTRKRFLLPFPRQFCRHSFPKTTTVLLCSSHHHSLIFLFWNFAQVDSYSIDSFVSGFFPHLRIFDVHLCYCSVVIILFYGCSVIWTYHSLFILSAQGHLNRFQFGAVIKLLGTVLCQIFMYVFTFLSGKCQRIGV